MAKEKKTRAIEIINRKAKFEYQFLQEYEAGIVLLGTEIKSIRDGNANLKDAFCFVRKGELFVKNMFIAEYKFGTHYNHETRRLRKLLMTKGELKKLERRVKEKGNTIVPYRLFISERGFAKLTLQLSQGKKSYDKRESIKEKDNKRDMDRIRRGKY